MHVFFLFIISLVFAIALLALLLFQMTLLFGNSSTLGKFVIVVGQTFEPYVTIYYIYMLSHLFLFLSLLQSFMRAEHFRSPNFRDSAVRQTFSLGFKANFVQVFGSRPLYWLIPIYTRSVLTGRFVLLEKFHRLCSTTRSRFSHTEPILTLFFWHVPSFNVLVADFRKRFWAFPGFSIFTVRVNQAFASYRLNEQTGCIANDTDRSRWFGIVLLFRETTDRY